MSTEDLEWFATEDLINELMRRATFQGVVIHAQHGVKQHQWEGERVFVARHNASLGTEAVGRLLEVVSQHIADLV